MMRHLAALSAGLALCAAVWSAGAGPAFGAGDDHENDRPLDQCQAGPVFVPGYSLGPVNIGAPLDAVLRWLGQPISQFSQSYQGGLWTRLVFAGLSVLARNNTVVALTLPQITAVPTQSNCGTIVSRSFYLPAGSVMQTYGVPPARITINGRQYWLYNNQGLLFALPEGGGAVQGVTVYPVGQYCTIAPMFVSLLGFSVNVRDVAQCSALAGPGQHPPTELK